MLCELLINSTLKFFPNWIVSPCVTICISVLLNNLCSSNLLLISPAANLVAYIGVFICFKKYGIPPIWSSWPCVITIPFNFSWFFTKYVISGITKSTPNISSSGNDKPQSTTIISSSYSNTVIFFPISCNPPNGIIFKLDFLNTSFAMLVSTTSPSFTSCIIFGVLVL